MDRTRRVVAVLGGSVATDDEAGVAERLGREIAGFGVVVLTGGGGGVMEAASRGAAEAGGLTVGILPGAEATDRYPNRWVQLPVFTGLGGARNVINVLSADLCVAVGGGAGTLSEVALALKSGIEVWWYSGWGLQPPASYTGPLPRTFDRDDELLEALQQRLGSWGLVGPAPPA